MATSHDISFAYYCSEKCQRSKPLTVDTTTPDNIWRAFGGSGGLRRLHLTPIARVKKPLRSASVS